MGFGSFLKKVINPLSPIKGIIGAGKAVAQGDFKNAAGKGLGATLGLNIGSKKRATTGPGWGGPPPGAMPGAMPGAIPGMPRQPMPAEVMGQGAISPGWGNPMQAQAQAQPMPAPGFDYEAAKAQFGVARAREMELEQRGW